jgi:hypothetical protein
MSSMLYYIVHVNQRVRTSSKATPDRTFTRGRHRSCLVATHTSTSHPFVLSCLLPSDPEAAFNLLIFMSIRYQHGQDHRRRLETSEDSNGSSGNKCVRTL